MYRLKLSEDDAATIGFVGYRYAWSDSLEEHGINVPGEHEIPEHIAWDLSQAFEADMDGGHSMFPLLDYRCELYCKLESLWDSIV